MWFLPYIGLLETFIIERSEQLEKVYTVDGGFRDIKVEGFSEKVGPYGREHRREWTETTSKKLYTE